MIASRNPVVGHSQPKCGQRGWRESFERLIDRVGNPTVGLQIVELVWLEAAGLSQLNGDDERFVFRFLEAEEIQRYAADPALRLSPTLVDRVAAEQDFCFAALEGEKLAAYGWYALDCIEGEHNFGIPMSFPSDTAYMYNGFTHPDYRGLRLHGRAMGLALRSLERQGVVQLVSTVDWTNQASLRSCDRLGYQRLGRIVTLGRTHLVVLRSPQQAEVLGIHFGHEARLRPKMPHPLAVVADAESTQSSDGLSCSQTTV